MSSLSRRDFLKTGAAAGAIAGIGNLADPAASQPATEWITLGKSGVRVTRLAFGTGTFSGEVQRDLGQEGLNRLVRHAYERGIRFFETAESYQNMHHMLGVALEGIPRENYRLMTKIETDNDIDPGKKIDDLRRAAKTDYFDIMLLHWQHTGSWVEDSVRWQDAIVEAQHQQKVLSRGVSVHGLPALRRVPTFDWLQIAMIRCNHKGTRMDEEIAEAPGLGNVDEVVHHIHQCRAADMGVISMKLAGEGVFNHEDRQKAMRFAFRTAHVNCVTVGYRKLNEIDEAIDNLNLAMA